MELVRCRACGFVQLAEHVDVIPFHARMEEPPASSRAPHAASRRASCRKAFRPAWAAIAVGVALLLWVPVTGKGFGPSDTVVRWLASPLALDPASHPTSTLYDVGPGP